MRTFIIIVTIGGSAFVLQSFHVPTIPGAAIMLLVGAGITYVTQ